MGVLTTLLILAGLIVVHETGHFLAATWQGIRVQEFSIGFGPALLSFHRKGVQFALRAIPLGGFVSYPDDHEEYSIPADDPDLLRNRPIAQRALVIAAGVIANLLLAYSILLAQGLILGIPAGFDASAGVLIIEVQPGQAAAAAGLKADDRILSIGGENLGGGQQAVVDLVGKIKASPDLPLRIKVDRAGQSLDLPLQPADLGGVGRIGAQLQPDGKEKFRAPQGLLEPIHQANRDFALLTRRTVEGFITLLTHFGETASQVSGPVKIVEMGASLASQNNNGLFLFTALISINLAVFNALPLPLLDGGQFALLLVEGWRGKPLPAQFQMAFMQSGFVFLAGLILVLIVKDTSQLPAIQNLLSR